MMQMRKMYIAPALQSLELAGGQDILTISGEDTLLPGDQNQVLPDDGDYNGEFQSRRWLFVWEESE